MKKDFPFHAHVHDSVLKNKLQSLRIKHCSNSFLSQPFKLGYCFSVYKGVWLVLFMKIDILKLKLGYILNSLFSILYDNVYARQLRFLLPVGSLCGSDVRLQLEIDSIQTSALIHRQRSMPVSRPTKASFYASFLFSSVSEASQCLGSDVFANIFRPHFCVPSP